MHAEYAMGNERPVSGLLQGPTPGLSLPLCLELPL